MAREKSPGTTTARKRAPAKRASKAATAPGAPPKFVDPQQRAALIAKAAYYRSMHRGFASGFEVEDWLAAEAEVDAELLRGNPGS